MNQKWGMKYKMALIYSVQKKSVLITVLMTSVTRAVLISWVLISFLVNEPSTRRTLFSCSDSSRGALVQEMESLIDCHISDIDMQHREPRSVLWGGFLWHYSFFGSKLEKSELVLRLNKLPVFCTTLKFLPLLVRKHSAVGHKCKMSFY